MDIKFEYLPVVSFAMQQNNVPLIQQFILTNNTEEAIKELRIQLTFRPDFAQTAESAVQCVEAGASLRIDTLQPVLDASFFVNMTERMAANITLTVLQGEAELFKQNYPIDILAFDQWQGLSVLPQLTAAFVTPNHPAITGIIRRASEYMKKWTDSPSMDEYQTQNPNRVRKQMAAIYEAIKEQHILYITAPASFENEGQRIRMSDAVLANKMGTCIDMALLYASCLEAVGIHPLLLCVQGHAFAGGWLVEDVLPDVVSDDPSLVSKLTADGINEMVLVETTGMNDGQDVNFDMAVKAANAHLLFPERFVSCIDIIRARFAHIRPLPQRVVSNEGWQVVQEDYAPKWWQKKASDPLEIKQYDLSGLKNEVELTKQTIWERKLLDLSLRNNLLNLRITSNTLQLMTTNIASLEDALSDGDGFQILSGFDECKSTEPGLLRRIDFSEELRNFVLQDMKLKRLHAYLSAEILPNALKTVYKASRLALEENGANTLYLAIGLLKWYETDKSEKARFAPILLYPVELVRKSLINGYTLRSRDEDIMLNITLTEMLRQNFGIVIPGLNPLPKDESGVDVNMIFSIIRQGIMKQKGWDVEEQVVLGTFSFNKFIMWNDIHTYAPQLRENRIVASLMDGKMEWQEEADHTDAAELDKRFKPSELILPVSADSSQLEAIYASTVGKSFILHGPPGTGKSQTITNIIANALYRGKRVLFVAEKMAALSVVQQRLERIGIGAFCLELHSNKAKKSDVLQQLQDTAAAVHTQMPETFEQEAEKLFALRSELNRYVDALHKPHPCGMSLYEAITDYVAMPDGDELDVPTDCITNLTREQLQQWHDCAEEIKAVCAISGHPYKHPLAGIQIEEFAADTSEKIKTADEKFIGEAQKFLTAAEACKDILDVGTPSTRQAAGIIFQMLETFANTPAYTRELLYTEGLAERRGTFTDLVAHGRKRDEKKAELAQQFTSDFLDVPAEMRLQEWKLIQLSWFLPRFFKKMSFKKKLRIYTQNTKKLSDTEVSASLEKLHSYQQERASVEEGRNLLSRLFADKAAKDHEQWDDLEKMFDAAARLETLFGQYAEGRNAMQEVRNRLDDKMAGDFESFMRRYAPEMNGYMDAFESMQTAENELFAASCCTPSQLYLDGTLADGMERVRGWQAHLGQLRDWYRWLALYRQAKACGFAFAADAYVSQNIPTEHFPEIFRKGFYKSLAQYIITSEEELRMFNGQLFDNEIAKFKTLDETFRTLVKRELYAKLAANVPKFSDSVYQNSEVGILQRNIRSNGRGTPIRKLFDSIPNLLERMCPCMLMSPISVAQYIDIDRLPFDLIIFDEASQMPTSEAVGTIARGKSLIVVGDPKQMPPTTFFAVNNTDEDNMELEDLESVLDDCLALTMPSKYLLWHYRSKHESLISFSNSQYYNNKLLTFPSPDNLKSNVHFVPVEGFYDKGRSRQNKAEAEAVVQEIVRRLRDPELSRYSIGVVTFSSVQQSLIEDLLSEAMLQDMDLEQAATAGDEPVFIKNLENVQGDERDIILFSVCYGPDEHGKVSHNFGPLNREGGERRLNVAVSRARYEMVVFSTLTADMIDLNRTAALGVAGLKYFLEYAQTGHCPAIALSETGKVREKDISDLIADELRAKGLTVDTHIGASGFKVDLGVVDAHEPSRYILGILCDGENYSHTKTARDREITQTSVLNALGWNICKVWTLDWWEDKERVINQIFKALEDVKNKPVYVKTDTNLNRANISIDIPAKEEKTRDDACETSRESMPPLAKTIENENGEPYKKAKVPVYGESADNFLLPTNASKVANQIKAIIEAEAPISQTLLQKKVINAWKITKAGTRIVRYFNELMPRLPYYKEADGERIFYWKSAQAAAEYSSFRPQSERAAAYIAPQEMANAGLHILQQQISLSLPDFIKATAKCFGFARAGTEVEHSVRSGIAHLQSQDKIKLEDGRVILK